MIEIIIIINNYILFEFICSCFTIESLSKKIE